MRVPTKRESRAPLSDEGGRSLLPGGLLIHAALVAHDKGYARCAGVLIGMGLGDGDVTAPLLLSTSQKARSFFSLSYPREAGSSPTVMPAGG